MGTITTIPVGTGGPLTLVLRVNELGRSVVVVDDRKGNGQTPPIVATSPAGCMALSEALKDMAQAMRDYKRGEE